MPVRRTLEKIGIPRATFYRWYDLYQSGGPEALDDRHPKPDRVWNRIPDDVRERIVNLALDESALSPRELAVRFTDTEGYFVSEASVYRLLKAHDLIASPAFIVMKAADEFKDKTTAPNQLWQADFTYLKVIGWGWFYLSTVLDDFSRYIIAWKLCATMKAEDVTATLELALNASGLDKAKVLHRPRLLSDKWHAERSARRPKPSKLALNATLRTYVEKRLAGIVVAPSGVPTPGPAVSWNGRRHGQRQDRRWARAWSPEQIARRLPIDFPDDKTMRISHEAIYQALFIQGRGELRRELTACLRTGRVLRVPRARTRRRGNGFVPPEIMISQRPAEAADRAVPGHWEGDLILGLGSSAIGILVERTTRFTMLLHLPPLAGHGDAPRAKNGPALAGHGAEAVRDAITRTIVTLPRELLDMTIYPYLPRAIVATTSAKAYMGLLTRAAS